MICPCGQKYVHVSDAREPRVSVVREVSSDLRRSSVLLCVYAFVLVRDEDGTAQLTLLCKPDERALSAGWS